MLILAIHVYDCTVTGLSHALVQQYKLKIKSKYASTDIGAINWLFDINITQDHGNRTSSLPQSSSINSLLKRFNLANCQPFSMSIDPNIWYSKLETQCPQTLEQATEMYHILYHEAVRLLLYPTIAILYEKVGETFILCAISVLPFLDSSPGLSPTKPKPGPTVGSGSGLSIGKPEPAEARPKPGLWAQAGPGTSLVILWGWLITAVCGGECPLGGGGSWALLDEMSKAVGQ